MLIQLPSDVVSRGYNQTRPYFYEQVFYSKQHNFKGTEVEFVKKGLGYAYRQIDRFTRQEIIL